jgi:hypothetical protein
MTRVEYVACDRPRIIADDMRDTECARLLNGLHAQARHCSRCDNRIRACKTREYRVRDSNGNIITDDWVMVP